MLFYLCFSKQPVSSLQSGVVVCVKLTASFGQSNVHRFINHFQCVLQLRAQLTANNMIRSRLKGQLSTKFKLLPIHSTCTRFRTEYLTVTDKIVLNNDDGKFHKLISISAFRVPSLFSQVLKFPIVIIYLIIFSSATRKNSVLKLVQA